MLGGTVVIISGPCFEGSDAKLTCKFNNVEVDGVVLSESLSLCTTPEMNRSGLITVEVEHDKDTYVSSFFAGKFRY